MLRTDTGLHRVDCCRIAVLGGTMGRLFRHLREEKGYTYSVSSGFSATQYPAAPGRHPRACAPRSPEPASDRISSPRLAELRDTPVPEAEFADVKRAIRRQLRARRLRIRNRYSATTSTTGVYGLPGDYLGYISCACHGDHAGAGAGGRAEILGTAPASRSSPLAMPRRSPTRSKKTGELEVYDSDGNPLK